MEWVRGCTSHVEHRTCGAARVRGLLLVVDLEPAALFTVLSDRGRPSL